MEDVREALCRLAERNAVEFSLVIPYEDAGLVNYIQERGVVDKLSYDEEGIFMSGRIPVSMSGPLKLYL